MVISGAENDLGQSYSQAGALDHLRRTRWIPPVYSPNRGFAVWGPPPDSATAILYVGYLDAPGQAAFLAAFALAEPALKLYNGFGIVGEDTEVTIWICRDPLVPMSVAWPKLTYMIVPQVW